MRLLRKISRFFVKDKARDQEETLKIIGALTVVELQSSRSFRRKIEKTEYGRKLKQIINY